MGDELIHEYAAGYVLHALGPEETRAYEEHLAHCPSCREDVAAFAETTASLGFAADFEPAPPELRNRILGTARAERAKVVPLRPRWAYPVVAAATVAACAAVGLGAWNISLHSQLSNRSSLQALPLSGATGSVVVAPNGAAELVVSGLPRPTAGKTYEAWVIRGNAALPAGLFTTTASGRTVVLRLGKPLGAGARVGITLEPAGGSSHPTSQPVVVSAQA
ncbi:MAG: anti-sigma factor [Gaiellaceae bacterium]